MQTERIYSQYIGMEFGIKNIPRSYEIVAKDKQHKEEKYQIRKALQRLGKLKLQLFDRRHQSTTATPGSATGHLIAPGDHHTLQHI